ncbi:hypothetical protein J6590_095483 [Homalodisca vitripennis]|nr:hypothetical protein J6590_095483 [Homalodisca vitripennis]
MRFIKIKKNFDLPQIIGKPITRHPFSQTKLQRLLGVYCSSVVTAPWPSRNALDVIGKSSMPLCMLEGENWFALRVTSRQRCARHLLGTPLHSAEFQSFSSFVV